VGFIVVMIAAKKGKVSWESKSGLYNRCSYPWDLRFSHQ